MDELIKLLDNLAGEFTLTTVRVTKKVQEVQYEPYELMVSETRLVRIEEKDELQLALQEQLDEQIIEMMNARGIQ